MHRLDEEMDHDLFLLQICRPIKSFETIYVLRVGSVCLPSSLSPGRSGSGPVAPFVSGDACAPPPPRWQMTPPGPGQ